MYMQKGAAAFWCVLRRDEKMKKKTIGWNKDSSKLFFTKLFIFYFYFYFPTYFLVSHKGEVLSSHLWEICSKLPAKG